METLCFKKIPSCLPRHHHRRIRTKHYTALLH